MEREGGKEKASDRKEGWHGYGVLYKLRYSLVLYGGEHGVVGSVMFGDYNGSL
jgi:hypothetical protein